MTTKVKLIADGVITPDQITLTTASSGTNTTAPATTAFVQQEISALVDSSPEALNTLNELAAALGDDENFSTTVTDSIATKLPLAGGTLTGNLNIVNTSGATLDINSNLAGVDSKILLHEGTSASPANGASIRYDGANNLFKIGVGSSVNTTRLTIARDTGNVGIGTDSPDALLHVKSLGNGEIEVERASGALINLQAQSARGVIGTDSNHDLQLKTNSTSRITISTSGRVGIGTISPDRKLHINESVSATSNFIHMTTAATGASGSNGFLVGIGSDGNAELWNYEAQPIIFATSSSERMRIDSSGNVGIGQTDPSGYWSQADNLVVGGSGNDGITIKSTSVGNGRLVFTDTKSTTAGLNDGGMLHYNHTDDVMIVHTAGSEAMRIDSSGSLLVSTTLNDGQSIGAGSQDGIVLAGVSQYIQRGGNANLWLSKPSGATNNTYINFYTNSSKVGSIGTFGGTTYYASNSHGFLINGTQIEPSNNTGGRLDNTVDIGSATYRFKNLYLSGGAYIGGTAAANKLDDYEEGTWTGTLGASTATTVTWGVGNYTKIGNMVYASFTVTVSEQTVGDNYIILYGPFAQHTASTHWIGFCNNYNSGNRESGIIINNSSGNTNEWFVGWQSNSTASKNVRGLIIYQTS